MVLTLLNSKSEMSKYDRGSFEALNQCASTIGRQNREFIEARKVKHPRHSALRQNAIAAEQRQHIQALGELSAELPYAELALEYEDVAAEFAEVQSQLPGVEDRFDMRKMGVIALADAVVKVMPWAEETAERRVAERLAEISAENRINLEARAAEIGAKLLELGDIYEVAGGPWPVPIAEEVEVPVDERFVVVHLNGNGNGNGRYADSGELVVASEVFEEPTIIDVRTPEERVREFMHLRRYQPHAKSLMTYYFAENPRRTVTVDELMDFIYSHVPEDEKTRNLRNSVTTMLGPKIQGKEMKRLMAEEGLLLQYGWQKIMYVNGSPKPKISRKRVYRAIPIDEAEGPLSEFKEELRLAA